MIDFEVIEKSFFYAIRLSISPLISFNCFYFT